MKVLIGVIALGMMIIGGMTVWNQLMSQPDTVMQQIAARIGMGNGITMFGAGLVALAICTLDDSPRIIEVESKKEKSVDAPN